MHVARDHVNVHLNRRHRLRWCTTCNIWWSVTGRIRSRLHTTSTASSAVGSQQHEEEEHSYEEQEDDEDDGDQLRASQRSYEEQEDDDEDDCDQVEASPPPPPLPMLPTPAPLPPLATVPPPHSAQGQDWFPGRDDSAALAASAPSELLGEVLLAPLPISNHGRPRHGDQRPYSDEEWLPALATNHKRYGRWRITGVEGSGDDAVVELYDIDRYSSHHDAHVFGRTVDRPWKSWRWKTLRNYATILGHADVLRNAPLSLDDDALSCEICGTSATNLGGRQALRSFDGNFPKLNRTAATADSTGSISVVSGA